MGARILVVDDSPTIRKVVTSILQASEYEPLSAEDGQHALEVLDAHQVDLVLVDFVMPRMNGYQFCRELRSQDHLRATPVVLMSAKGDKIRGQFLQQTGAIDAITKPFDARGLIAVVEAALKKQERGARHSDDPAPAVVPGAGATRDSLIPDSIELSLDPAQRRHQAAREFAAALGRMVVPSLLKISGLPEDAEQRFTEALLRSVDADSMGSLSSLLRALDFGEGTREVLAGDVGVISIAEVLQVLQMQRQSGALNVAKRGSEVTLYIRKGHLALAVARGLREEFLISRYLVERGLITRDKLDEILSDDSGPRKLLGERLVEQKLVTEEQVRGALRRQSSELVYEVVRWEKGRFAFTVGVTSPVAEQANLEIPTGSLVMEGFRRVDEWRLIEGSFDFDEALYRDETSIDRLGEHSELTSLELRVLQAIDGERTVREVVDDIGGSSFELCKILYQFLNSRLVRRKGH